MTAIPSSRKISPGTGTTYSVSVTPSGGFNGTVSFSVSGLPSGATATFNPSFRYGVWILYPVDNHVEFDTARQLSVNDHRNQRQPHSHRKDFPTGSRFLALRFSQQPNCW